MPKTVGIERTLSKYVARAGVAGPDYEKGVKAPKRPWAESAAGAKDTYRAAITEADIPDRFARGITKAGNEKWSKMAVAKGVARFAAGVDAGKEEYKSSMSEVLSTIEGITLKDRGPRGSATNYDRVKAIGDALHAARLARG